MKRLLIAALAASIAMPAFGQSQNCAARFLVEDRLGGGYGESVQSLGVTDNGAVIEMWANVDTGTWTAVVNLPDGTACVVASGVGFERIDSEVHPTGVRL